MYFFKNNNKTRGFLGTTLFHFFLLLCFFFLGLKYQDPPPNEEGISINFGFNNQGSDKIEPEDIEKKTKIIEKEKIKQVAKINENIIDQKNINTVKIEESDYKKEKEIDKSKEKKILKEKEKEKINERALYKGKKKNEAKNEGTTNKKGNQGVIKGSKKVLNHSGLGTGENGKNYLLSGRDMEVKVIPEYNTQSQGKVIVSITVNQLGNVINAIAGVKGSTTLDPELLKKAKEAALKTKFNPDYTAPINQQGKIIYNFSLN